LISRWCHDGRLSIFGPRESTFSSGMLIMQCACFVSNRILEAITLGPFWCWGVIKSKTKSKLAGHFYSLFFVYSNILIIFIGKKRKMSLEVLSKVTIGRNVVRIY
jgi:hypothetical protein